MYSPLTSLRTNTPVLSSTAAPRLFGRELSPTLLLYPQPKSLQTAIIKRAMVVSHSELKRTGIMNYNIQEGQGLEYGQEGQTQQTVIITRIAKRKKDCFLQRAYTMPELTIKRKLLLLRNVFLEEVDDLGEPGGQVLVEPAVGTGSVPVSNASGVETMPTTKSVKVLHWFQTDRALFTASRLDHQTAPDRFLVGLKELVTTVVLVIHPVGRILLSCSLDPMKAVLAGHEPDGDRDDPVVPTVVRADKRCVHQLQGPKLLRTDDMVARGAGTLALDIRTGSSNSTLRGRVRELNLADVGCVRYVSKDHPGRPTATKSKDQMDHAFLLDVVLRQLNLVLELFSCKMNRAWSAGIPSLWWNISLSSDTLIDEWTSMGTEAPESFLMVITMLLLGQAL